jgi:hypothetical protein
MEKETIIDYINNHNELTYEGIEWDFQNPRYETQRSHLLSAADEIQKCVWWLVEFYKPNKSMKNLKSSYGLKYYVEKYFGTYISNGSFVAAVELLRMKNKRYEDDPNIYLPFNKNRLKEYRKKYFNPRG